jgi:4a-hydroxytetrahydrobiopterin dehydratase
MARPSKLPKEQIDQWLGAHASWAREGEALVRTYTFADFSSALGFVVRVGMLAEKRDHHPDVELGWGRAKLRWTTHDAGGITSLDTELAEKSDALGGFKEA